MSSEDDLHKILMVRERTRTLVSFGDCAVTANVPAMRNPIGVQPLLRSGVHRERDLKPAVPVEVVPRLLPMARPVHAVVNVDLFLPGCPPSADLIYHGARRPARGSHARHRRQPASGAEANLMTRHDRHRPGHPDRRPLQDHDPPRRCRRGGRRPLPRHPVPRLRADRPGPADPRDAVDHGAHLRHLPGQPPDRLVEGLRPDPRRRTAADRRRPAPGHEPGPDRAVERPELLPPLVARPAVRLRRRPGAAQHHRRRQGEPGSWPTTAWRPPVRPADHRVAGRQAHPPVVDRAGRRRCRRSTRRRATGSWPPSPMRSPRSSAPLAWYKSQLVQLGRGGRVVRRLPLGVHGAGRRATATSTTTTAGCG